MTTAPAEPPPHRGAGRIPPRPSSTTMYETLAEELGFRAALPSGRLLARVLVPERGPAAFDGSPGSSRPPSWRSRSSAAPSWSARYSNRRRPDGPPPFQRRDDLSIRCGTNGRPARAPAERPPRPDLVGQGGRTDPVQPGPRFRRAVRRQRRRTTVCAGRTHRDVPLVLRRRRCDPRARPSRSGGVVAVADTRGILHAIDQATGMERWRADGVNDIGNVSGGSPLRRRAATTPSRATTFRAAHPVGPGRRRNRSCTSPSSRTWHTSPREGPFTRSPSPTARSGGTSRPRGFRRVSYRSPVIRCSSAREPARAY